MSSVKSNYLYATGYQVLNILLPLITIPYVSRILGIKGVGIFSYSQSIVYIFILIAMLGIVNYGSRIIATSRDDKNKLSRVFSSLYAVQVSTVTVSIVLYIVYYLTFQPEPGTVFLLQLIYLSSALFDISWFFFGIEKFKSTVIRNTLIKLLSVIAIFIFVRDAGDLPAYTFIISLGFLMGNLVLFALLPQHTSFTKFTKKEYFEHFYPILILFIPVIAVSIYTIINKVLLGIISSAEAVGIFDSALRIMTVPTSLISALGTIMLPHMSNLVAKQNKKHMLATLRKSMRFIMSITLPMTIGVVLTGHKFAPIFLGSEFSLSGDVLVILGFTITIVAWANVIRTQFLIPTHRDNVYVISVISGAVISLLISLIAIPVYGALGAAISALCAEIIVAAYQTYRCKDELPIKRYLMDALPFVYGCVPMTITVLAIDAFMPNTFYVLFIKILLAATVYVLWNYRYFYKLVRR